MARTTRNLYVTKSGFTNQREPNTVFPTNSSTQYHVSRIRVSSKYYIRELLFGFQEFPDSLKYARLYDVGYMAYVYHKNVSTTYISLAAFPCEDFDTSTLTYNNKPDFYSYSEYFAQSALADSTWGNQETTQSGSAVATLSEAAAKAIRAGNVLLRDTHGYEYETSSDYNNYWLVRTVLANGTAPYVTVTYDNAETVASKISAVTTLPATVDPTVAQTVTWDLIRDTAQDYYCVAESWEQASATLYWRLQGSENWTQISISGDTKECVIPAGTFQSGNTYEYYIQATDVLGTTTQTDTFTTTTPATQIYQSNSPTSGYVNPRNAQSFGWYYSSTVGTVGAGSTTLHWRESGAETWNDVAAATGTTSLTIAANTFPTASTIEWYLSGTDATGYASETTVYSFSTTAGTVISTPISPISTVEDNGAPITFRWAFASADGFPVSRFEFWWKRITEASNEWHELLDLNEALTTYTFPANTFPAGELNWIVRPYNIDGTLGTRTAATFISYGAPTAPVVYATEVPFTTVTWQAEDQQAYEIQIDDTLYGPYFGTEKTFSVPEKLDDGQHAVKVRIMGTYALWSQYGETAITVENTPGETVTLSGTAGVSNSLTWETAEATSDFLVYRDGVQIGITSSLAFEDRYVTGTHTYKVVNRLTNGNFSESNEVTLTTEIDGTYIALLSGGDWTKIRFTLTDQSDQSYDDSAETVYNHISGDTFPSVILGETQESKLSYSAVFFYTQQEAHESFVAMFGKAVIMKFKTGEVIPGVLDSWTKQRKREFWTGYNFTLRRIELEDFRDDTD